MVVHFLTGKLVTIVGFTAAAMSAFAYYRSAQSNAFSQLENEWKRLARLMYWVMLGAIVINGIHLLTLIWTHQFQYNYVKHYSSTDLNPFYLLSTFYAGQEGSFMLWMFYGSLFGYFLIRTAKEYEAPVMAILMLSQAFLLSMILGIEVPGLGTLGSDPFALVQGPIPTEGDGLNPLLQNPWMVIHPPTLFVGFSSLIVPYAFAIAAVWKNKYNDWIRPAMPWVLLSAAVLGTGIMMGGYWAYKVLGWGGYWGWDPVENSSLVPWLLTVSLIHTMIVQKKNGGLKKTNILFAILAFTAVLYSAFLTRSGVLADFSVHSFTDLGLYNQLLAFFVLFLLIGVGLLLYRLKAIPSTASSDSIYSREFFLHCGSVVLFLIAIVVASGTSAPIINRFFTDKPDPVLPEFYNRVTLPLAVLIGLLSAIGQLIWWKKIDKENLIKSISTPISLAMIFTSLLVVMGMRDAGMILLALAASFSLFANAQVFWKVAQGNVRFAGGSITHVGLGLMLLGIIGSAKYGENKHLELPKGETVTAFGKKLTYTGMELIEGAKSGFRIEVETTPEDVYLAMPVMYETQRMTVQNPDVLHFATQDFYISPVNLMTKKSENELILKKGESQTIKGVTVQFTGFNFTRSSLNPQGGAAPVRVVSTLSVTYNGILETIEPVYVIAPGSDPVIQTAALKSAPDISLAVTNIDASNGRVAVDIIGLPNQSNQPSETLLIEASTKPYINVLWMGTYLVFLGFGFSIYRRWKERVFLSKGVTKNEVSKVDKTEINEMV
ncbi:MAG: cytochrome c biogenesis protein CcsA [Chloroherpetonaceae bacterium]|nr:cytochrome c biogenesis protein CcsA [Chloroherpetonaceae bacterium]